MMTGATSNILKDTITYDPQKGGSVRKKAQFASYSAAFAYVQSIPGHNGYKWEITPMQVDDWHEVTMESGAGSYGGSGSDGITQNDPNAPLNDIWELQPNAVEKDFLASTDLAAVGKLMEGITAANIETIQTAIQNNTGSGTLSGNQLKIYKLKKAGVNGKSIFQPVLRHTKLVRQDYSVQTALTNVGNIFTSTQLYSLEGVPPILLFNIPTSSTVTLGNGLTVYVGWMKGYPTITQVVNGQWQIVQDFAFGEWATDLYSAAS